MTDVPENPVASLLRRAAEGMREAAKAATEGPWWFDEDENMWRLHGVHATIPAQMDGLIPEQVINHQILKAPKQGTPYAEYWPNEADGAWITRMHPGVGLAIAGWLDDDAERARLSMGHFDGEDCCDGQSCVHRHAPGWWHDGGEDAEWSCNDPWTGGEDGCMCFAGAVATARAWLGEMGDGPHEAGV